MARKRVKLTKTTALEKVMAEGAAKRFAEEDATKAAEEAQQSARRDKFRDQISRLSAHMQRVAWMQFNNGEDPDAFLPGYLNKNRGIPISSIVEVKSSAPSGAVATTESESVERCPEIPDQGDWGAIIRDRIKAEGWSCYALGAVSGVDASIILRFVAGARDIRLETAQKLCTALGLALVPLAAE